VGFVVLVAGVFVTVALAANAFRGGAPTPEALPEDVPAVVASRQL